MFPNYKNKKVLILGLGIMGRGIQDSIFFAKKGAQVTVTDLKDEKQLAIAIKQLKKYKNISFVLGRHRKSDIDKADLIIRNADVPRYSKYLEYAFDKKKNVDMDESLFAKYCPCPIIGITGTRGKTTTTMLIYEILKQSGKTVHLGGNIMGKATLPLIDKVKKDDLVVLELSSWQLQGFDWAKISPHIAVFTNVFPDHLNRYKNMAEYANDKKVIFKYQTKDDYLVANKNNPTVFKASQKAKSKSTFFTGKEAPKNWEINLFGKHNLENIAAAVTVAKILKIKITDIKKAVENFKSVEHRLEFVKKINNVTYINDTTSTTPIAGQKALEAFDQPIILLAGGASKLLDLSDFAKEAAKKTKTIILLEGSATDDLQKLLEKFGAKNKILGRFNNFRTAIKTAQKNSTSNDIVLLSPGCASFGMFLNEYDRGNQFKKIVKSLK